MTKSRKVLLVILIFMKKYVINLLGKKCSFDQDEMKSHYGAME